MIKTDNFKIVWYILWWPCLRPLAGPDGPRWSGLEAPADFPLFVVTGPGLAPLVASRGQGSLVCQLGYFGWPSLIYWCKVMSWKIISWNHWCHVSGYNKWLMIRSGLCVSQWRLLMRSGVLTLVHSWEWRLQWFMQRLDPCIVWRDFIKNFECENGQWILNK